MNNTEKIIEKILSLHGYASIRQTWDEEMWKEVELIKKVVHEVIEEAKKQALSENSDSRYIKGFENGKKETAEAIREMIENLFSEEQKGWYSTTDGNVAMQRFSKSEVYFYIMDKIKEKYFTYEDKE